MRSRSSTLKRALPISLRIRAGRFVRASGKVAVAAALFALAGCALMPPAPPVVGAKPVTVKVFQITGRISVIQDGAGFFGGLHWRHRPSRDVILLFTPLGQGVARLTRDPTGVTLTTADQRYVARDPAQLTEKVLGWRLPLGGLPYWILGFPAPGGGGIVTAGRLVQDGWRIEWDDYRAVDGFRLPGEVTLQQGKLRVKLVIDRWRIGQKAQ